MWEPKPNQLHLADDEVHVFCLRLDLDAADRERLGGCLSEDEWERARRFRFDEHRHRFIAARGQLRRLLGQCLNCLPEQLRFECSARGKPSLVDNPANLHFNVSHSEDVALIALAIDREVGVDVEHCRREIEALEIARRFFSPNEIQALRSLPEDQRRRAFFCVGRARKRT